MKRTDYNLNASKSFVGYTFCILYFQWESTKHWPSTHRSNKGHADLYICWSTLTSDDKADKIVDSAGESRICAVFILFELSHNAPECTR